MDTEDRLKKDLSNIITQITELKTAIKASEDKIGGQYKDLEEKVEKLEKLEREVERHARALYGENSHLKGVIDIVSENQEFIKNLIKVKEAKEAKDAERRRLLSIAGALLLLVEFFQILIQLFPGIIPSP